MSNLRKEQLTTLTGPGILQSDGSGNIVNSTDIADGSTATTQSPNDNSTKLATTAYADNAAAGSNEFSELTDVTGAYTTQNAIYRVNDATDGLEETTTKLTEPAANEFSIERGTSLFEVTTSSKIDQDLQQTASPTHVGMTLTGLSDGIVKSSTGVLSGGNSVDLTSEVSNELPIANGGTNSSTALGNDKVIVSSSGAIVESATIGTTNIEVLNGIDTIVTGTADNDTIITLGYFNDNTGGGSLAQNQKYYVGKAGNDSNSGKSVNEPFLTIGAAITAASGDTPSPTNHIGIQVIDGGTYTEDITSLGYVSIVAEDAVIVGNYTAVDNSYLRVKRLRPKTTTPFRAITKSAGTGIATVSIGGALDLGVNAGIQCSAGILNISCAQITSTTGTPIPTGSTGTININVSGNINLGVASFCVYNTAGTLNLIANNISNGAASLFNFSSGTGFHHIKVNRAVSADRVFALGSGPVVHFEANYWEEVNASTISGNLQYRVSRFKRTGDSFTEYARIRNDTGGIILDAPSLNVELANNGAVGVRSIGGLAQFPRHPAFSARVNSIQSNVTGDGTTYNVANYGDEWKDINNNFNPTTGVFTVPYSGWYFISGEVILSGVTSSHTDVDLGVITTDPIRGISFEKPMLVGNGANVADLTSGGLLAASVGFIEYLSGTSTVYVQIRGSNGTKVIDLFRCIFAGVFWGV